MTAYKNDKEQGQGSVEYALLLTGVAITVIGILLILGIDVAGTFCKVANVIGVSSACGSNVLFADDFSGGLGQWRLIGDQKWNDEGGRLCSRQNGEYRAFANGSNGRDYTISVNAILNRGNGYGLFFRANGGERVNGYTFQYDPGYGGGHFIMRKWVNGYELWPPFAANRAPANYQWFGVERHIQLNVNGNTYTANIDGETVLVGHDDTYMEGGSGLRVWSPGNVCFDDFWVTVP